MKSSQPEASCMNGSKGRIEPQAVAVACDFDDLAGPEDDAGLTSSHLADSIPSQEQSDGIAQTVPSKMSSARMHAAVINV